MCNLDDTVDDVYSYIWRTHFSVRLYKLWIFYDNFGGKKWLFRALVLCVYDTLVYWTFRRKLTSFFPPHSPPFLFLSVFYPLNLMSGFFLFYFKYLFVSFSFLYFHILSFLKIFFKCFVLLILPKTFCMRSFSIYFFFFPVSRTLIVRKKFRLLFFC